MNNDIICRFQGEWEKSRSFLQRGMEATPRDTRLRTLSVLLEYECGNFAEGQVHLDFLIEGMSRTASGPTAEYGYPSVVIPIVTRITGDLEQLEVAKEAAETILSYPSVLPFMIGYARIGLALIAVQVGDAVSAAEQYAATRELGLINVAGLLPIVVRIYGLLAQAMGDFDQAMNHFEDSLTICRKAGYRPELAWTCCDYSDMLRERDAEGDRAKAIALLEESLAISSELGMRPLMERVLSRREILEA